MLRLVLGGNLQTNLIVWKSSAPGIADARWFSDHGAKVYAVRPGIATIWAGVGSIYGAPPRDSVSAAVDVLPVTAQSMVLTLENLSERVFESFDDIHIVPDTVRVAVDDSVMLYPVVRDSVGTTLLRSGTMWTSSDTCKARILGRPDVHWLPEYLSGGTTEIHIKKEGTVRISASSEHLTASALIKAN